MSESKPDESVEQDSLDELDALRAEHALSSSSMGAAARARERLDEESALRSGCLLYTSPSPRDMSASRMPSSA